MNKIDNEIALSLFNVSINSGEILHSDLIGIRKARIAILKAILEKLPAMSSTLKLNAKEKFIWLSGIQEVHKTLTKMMEE